MSLHTDPSFPSGHALVVLTLAGALLYLFYGRLPSPPARLAALAGLLVWGLLNGLARLFAGAHYFSDLLAGYCLGLGVLGMAILLVDGYRVFDRRDGSRTR
jgi:undecaprenyl-diphosphatase